MQCSNLHRTPIFASPRRQCTVREHINTIRSLKSHRKSTSLNIKATGQNLDENGHFKDRSNATYSVCTWLTLFICIKEQDPISTRNRAHKLTFMYCGAFRNALWWEIEQNLVESDENIRTLKVCPNLKILSHQSQNSQIIFGHILERDQCSTIPRPPVKEHIYLVYGESQLIKTLGNYSIT
jgi:hypothetical protein